MICNTCQRLKVRNHVCVNQKYCKNCKDVVELDHKCYILNSKKTTTESSRGYIFFDYEAYQCPEKLKHVANLIIAENVKYEMRYIYI